MLSAWTKPATNTIAAEVQPGQWVRIGDEAKPAPMSVITEPAS